jgi:DNA polymerase III subunit delta
MITTISGLNSYESKLYLDKIVTSFIAKLGEFGLVKLQAEETSYEKICESVQTMPFLADKQLVVIYNPSSNKQLTEKIKEFIPSINPTTDVVFVEPIFDKRSSIYKVLKKDTLYKEFTELDERTLVNWLVSYAIEQECSLSQQDARYLLSRVGINQKKLQNELEKLCSYSTKISKITIDLLIEPSVQSTIFDLLDAALSNDTKKIVMLYQEQRVRKVEPQEILAMLAWQLHILATVKASGNRSVDDTARQAKIKPFVVQKTMKLSQNVSMSDIKKYVSRTLETDINLKSKSIDPNDAVLVLLLTLKK